MIDLELSPIERNIRDMAHWFGESEVRPVSLRADREGRFPDELLVKMMKLGFVGGQLPGVSAGEGSASDSS